MSVLLAIGLGALACSGWGIAYTWIITRSWDVNR